MDEQVIGKVIHYFDKAMVAVIKLDGDLKLGENLKFSKAGESFETKVDSMQIDHKAITEARAGQEVAIKVNNPTKEGAVVYKLTD